MEKQTCLDANGNTVLMNEDYCYNPVVGDSVTGDTPLFIKYNETGYIDIIPIEEIFNIDKSQRDILGREYDLSPKKFKVLCRSGWVSPKYIYRHETNKTIYQVKEGDMMVECTEDHSLFNDKQEKIKPSEINPETRLEYYTGEISHSTYENIVGNVKETAKAIADKKDSSYDRIPIWILNGTNEIKERFYWEFIAAIVEKKQNIDDYSKTLIAGLQYIKKK